MFDNDERFRIFFHLELPVHFLYIINHLMKIRSGNQGIRPASFFSVIHFYQRRKNENIP